MKKLQTWYNILSVVVITILLTMVGGSGSGLAKILKEFAPNNDVVIQRDTVVKVENLVEIQIDSFYQKEIVYLDRVVPSAPDTVYIVAEDTISRYAGVVEDTTININYEAETIGQLVGLELSYEIKKPTLIEKTVTETVFKTETITEKIYKGGFYIGSGLRYEPAQSPIITTDVGYLTPKGWYYGYSFEPSTKSHKITAKKRLF